MKDNPEYKRMYEEYKAKRERQGLPLMDQGEYIRQYDKESKQLSKKTPKKVEKVTANKPFQMTEEQLKLYEEYCNKVKKAEKQKFNSKRTSLELNLMDLTEAKKSVFSIMKEEAKKRNFDFEVDDYNRHILDHMTRYFIRNEDFNGSLDKGLALVGNAGLGKTFLFHCFQIFTVKHDLPTQFLITPMDVISREAVRKTRGKEEGLHVVEQFTSGIRFYDDVGFEEKLEYGKCVFTEVMRIAYNKFLKTGKVCHITSNLSNMAGMTDFETLESKYGNRVSTRMNEMFNFSLIGGQNRRK